MKDEKKKEESYAFIEETVVPRKKSKGKKLVISIVTTIGLAVVFGVVASLSMCFCVPSLLQWAGVNEKTEGKKQIVFSDDTSSGTAIALEESPTPAVTVSPSKKPTSTPTSTPSRKPTAIPTVSPEAAQSGSEPTEAANEKKQKKITLSIQDYEQLCVELTALEQKLQKSLVTVSNVKEQSDMFDSLSQTQDEFYGLLVADNGEELLFLTSYDRVNGAQKLEVRFSGGESYEAEIYGHDDDTGIAILAVKNDSVAQTVYQGIEVATLGDSYGLKRGNPVVAVGSPNGYVFSMESGIITNDSYARYRTDQRIDLINTDLFSCDQGEGVLINLEGKVVGILTHQFSETKNEGICVAMGISRVKPLIERLVNQKKSIYFGAVESELSSEVLSGVGLENGIYISEVIADSPALNAGIHNGDILISVDGHPVNSVAYFSSLINEYKAGDKIKVALLRTSKVKMPEIEVEVELQTR